MDREYKIGAIIVAAGSGLRFGERKQFKKLGAKPLYLYSLQSDRLTPHLAVLYAPRAPRAPTATFPIGDFGRPSCNKSKYESTIVSDSIDLVRILEILANFRVRTI